MNHKVNDFSVIISMAPGENRAFIIDRNQSPWVMMSERKDQSSLVGCIFHGIIVESNTQLNWAMADVGLDQPIFIAKPQSVHKGAHVMVQIIRDSPNSHSALDNFSAKAPTGSLLPILKGRYLKHSVQAHQKPIGGSNKVFETLTEIFNSDTLSPHVQRFSPTRFFHRSLQDAIKKEAEDLLLLTAQINEKYQASQKPEMIDEPPQLLERILHDYEPHAIMIDDPIAYDQMKKMVQKRYPDLKGILSLWKEQGDILWECELNDVAETIKDVTFELPHGGFATIEVTEALTAIDINSAGHQLNKADIPSFNQRALSEIVRQISLRQLAGLVLIDVIGRPTGQARAKLLNELKTWFKKIGLRADILGYTPSGLIELTIPRTRNSLAQQLYDLNQQKPEMAQLVIPKPGVEAARLLREIFFDRNPHHRIKTPTIIASAAVIESLQSDYQMAVIEIEKRKGNPVILEALDILAPYNQGKIIWG